MGTCHSILQQGSQEVDTVGRDPMLTPALSADDIIVEDLGGPRRYHFDHILKDNHGDNNGSFGTKPTNADKKKPGLALEDVGMKERSKGLHGLNENARPSVDEDRQRNPVDSFPLTKTKFQRARDLQRGAKYGVQTCNAGIYRYSPHPLIDNDMALTGKNTTYSSRDSPDFNDYYWQPHIYKSNPQQSAYNNEAKIRSTYYKSSANSELVARNKFGWAAKDKFAEERENSRPEVCISNTKQYISSTLFGHRKRNNISPRNSKVKPNICPVIRDADIDIGVLNKNEPTTDENKQTCNVLKLELGDTHMEEKHGGSRDNNNVRQPLSTQNPCKQHAEFTCKDGSGGYKQPPFVKRFRKLSAYSANLKANRQISACPSRDNRLMSAKAYFKNFDGVLHPEANGKIDAPGCKRNNSVGIFSNSDAWFTPRETAENSAQDRVMNNRGYVVRNRINSANRIRQEKQKFINENPEQREAQNCGKINGVIDCDITKTNVSAHGRLRLEIVKKHEGEKIFDAEEAFGDDQIGKERCNLSTKHQSTSDKTTASEMGQDKQNLFSENGDTAIDSQQIFNKKEFGTVAFFEQTRRENAAFKEHLAGIAPHVDSWNVVKTKPEKSLQSDLKESTLEDAKIGSCTFYELQIQKQAEVRKMLKNTSTRLNTWQSLSKMKLCRGKGFSLKQ